MNEVKIYHDLQGYDKDGRIKLTGRGTTNDLEKNRITLCDKMKLTFWCDDLNDQGEEDEIRVEGVVHFDKEANCWVATLDWDSFRHASEEQAK